MIKLKAKIDAGLPNHYMKYVINLQPENLDKVNRPGGWQIIEGQDYQCSDGKDLEKILKSGKRLGEIFEIRSKK